MITNTSSPEEKIALFLSRFRGREDVYARRFENRRTGKSGYAPACANEWVRGVCEKPRIKCAKCPHRQFLLVNHEAARWHLTGKDDKGAPFVMGVYPMLPDETCWFLALDLDKKTWREDAAALRETCSRLNLPFALERSRSGNGAHLWMFFSEAIPASLARKLGASVLTETMESRPDLGFDSYDRMFPNQDTLPDGGFGNLIALPLQRAAREQGNTLFLNESFDPYPDQWAFLSSLKTLSPGNVMAHVERAAERGKILGVRTVPDEEHAAQPWFAPPSRSRSEPVAGPLPEKLEFILGDQIYLPKSGLTPSLRNRLLRLAAFQNPEFYKAQAMRLPTYGKPRIVACAEEYPEHIALPRGCLEEIRSVMKHLKIKVKIRDERHKGTPVLVEFKGALREDQQEAMTALCAHDTGVLAATTAFGKTVLAAAMIAERGVNTLVLVHRQQLMDQWVERLSEFTILEEKEIGRLGGGRRKLKGKVDIALLQSMVRKGVVDDRIADYGHIIVDECHHVSARNFELAVRRAKARYILGLSATVTRKDGHHPIVFMQCGPVRHQVQARAHLSTNELSKEVIVRPTSFRSTFPESQDVRQHYTALIEELIRDESRNEAILRDVRSALVAGARPLVLTERTEHLALLASRLQEDGNIRVVTLQGGMKKRELREAVEATGTREGGPPMVLIATGKFVGEGFDDPELDSLFLTLPVSWKGIVAQYAGRLHRRSPGKTLVRIYDYADVNEPMFARMFDRRCKGYEQLGYTVLLPASAIPGWPANVPLPVDPEWKRKHAASVQRLVRDGVDVPLAELFVEAACTPVEEEKTGIDRARSASEAFLWKRLESLAETVGRFQLNHSLPIPFMGQSSMEVDFLDEHGKLVVELDGPRHLGDPDAYRRDREKDLRLQQNGYMVVRFLATDLTEHLNEVLDTILRIPAPGTGNG